MKLNKTCIALACCSFIIPSIYIANKNINKDFAKAEITYNDNEPSYIDTKNKSADSQFETTMGIFTEIPLFNNNEKIKNILYSNSSSENINQANLLEIKDIILHSGYKYDEVIIQIENEDYVKYNPFTDEINHGILDDNYNFKVIKDYSL